jgi:predicted amidohydrolase YtcJ
MLQHFSNGMVETARDDFWIPPRRASGFPPMRVLAATVTRRTRSGDILGPVQRVDVMTALKEMTIWPAWQHFEQETKGSTEVGKLADFVILSDDTMSTDLE